MSLESYTDEQLMLILGQGQTQALEELIHRYQSKAMGLVYRNLGNWDLAEDLSQEAFLRVFRAAPRYRPEARFSTWFYRIVANLCTDEVRKSIRRGTENPDQLEFVAGHKHHDPVVAQHRKEKQDAVQQAIAALNERERMAVILHRFEGLSHKDIAEILDSTAAAVESLLVRAYRKLRQSLTDFKDDA